MTLHSARTAEEYLRAADLVLRSTMDRVVRESGGARPTLALDTAVPSDPAMPTDRYGVLLRSIVNQNLSGGASRTIYQRLIERFGGRPPAPQEILDDDPEELRTAAGLSRAKTASLRSLAEHIVSGELDLDGLHDLPDGDVLARLQAVKGIGPWTADIFLLFHLHRPDVLPVGDLGLRHAVEIVYELTDLPDAAELRGIAEPWRPHRSLACVYIWRATQTTPQV
jgi:DNA-3-methyladenine glycosylase II